MSWLETRYIFLNITKRPAGHRLRRQQPARARHREGIVMNAPAGKFLIEDTWRGRVFGTEWRGAAGGSLDVLEPATGAKITSVGNATAADVRKAAAEARAAQPGWAATPYEERAAILRKAARVLEDNQEELIPWIARETGGIPAKAGFEIHMVTEGLYRAAAMCTEPQGLVLPSNPGRISLARRIPHGVIGIIRRSTSRSSCRCGRSARRWRPAIPWCSSPIRAPS
jgi:aldehyde dehydrogenase family protein